ncbi:hypothetical protein [Streptomyces acidicola]|uniref:hypothetical protein n=1 Tax=Streptomyces acidicola TaxID=2596892 RepID=UPI003449E9D3
MTGRDRVAECQGEVLLPEADLRDDVDGEGDFGFDVLLPCPVDPECAGQAWAPVYSVTDLHKALTGAMDSDPDIVCTVHGDGVDDDQDDDPEGRADLQAQYADAVA